MITDVVIANKTYAKINIADTTGLDDVAIKVIRQDAPDFLLPMKLLEMNGELELRYEISDGIRLCYLSEVMTRTEFLTLLESMLLPLKECNDWFLNHCNFYLDANYIVVGKKDARVRYIYVPDAHFTQTEESVLNFLGDFILNANLSDDPMCIMNLYRHVKGKDSSIITLLDFIEHEARGRRKTEKIQETVPRPMKNTEQSRNELPPIQSVAQESTAVIPQSAQEQFGKPDVQNELMNNLFGEPREEPKKKKKDKQEAKEKRGVFGGLFSGRSNADKKGAKSVQAYEVQQGAVLQQPQVQVAPPIQEPSQVCYEEDVTFIAQELPAKREKNVLMLELEQDKGYPFPQFIEINLEKGYTTVGRYDKAGNPQSDYNFDATLSFISRKHCRIEKKEKGYVIIDLGSVNGTILNNELLVANMPYPFKEGDRIIFSRNHRITYKVC